MRWRRGQPPNQRRKRPGSRSWSRLLRVMDSDSSHTIEVTVEADAWQTAVTDPEQLVGAQSRPCSGARRRPPAPVRGRHRAGRRRPRARLEPGLSRPGPGDQRALVPGRGRLRRTCRPAAAARRRRRRAGDDAARGGRRRHALRRPPGPPARARHAASAGLRPRDATTRRSGWRRGRSSCWPGWASPTPTGRGRAMRQLAKREPRSPPCSTASCGASASSPARRDRGQRTAQRAGGADHRGRGGGHHRRSARRSANSSATR